MQIIKESFKQACPHCYGDGFTIEPECCGRFNSNDFVDKICCLNPNPVQAQCGHCNGTGFIEVQHLVRPEWMYPEIMREVFTL